MTISSEARADQWAGDGETRPFPAVFGVLTEDSASGADALECHEPDSPVLKPRNASNDCPDRFCGHASRYSDLACAARARADRQYLFRPAAPTAGQYRSW